MTAYAELQVTTNFSFLEGASHAGELVSHANFLGLKALAITDRNTLAGVVQAHVAARNTPLQIIVGARLDFRDGPSALCLPTDRKAYSRLSQLISLGRRRAPKGESWIDWPDFLERIEGQQVILLPPRQADEAFEARLAQVHGLIGDNLSLGFSRLYRSDDKRRLARLTELAQRHEVATLATNDVLYHRPERKVLQDVLTCIRHGCTIDAAGRRLQPNAERHLKSAAQMAKLFKDYPEAVARSIEIAGRCRFSLDELRYEYPDETQGNSRSPQDELVRLTWEGAADRYPAGIPPKIQAQLRHELGLIERVGYAPYFLTVHDIVRFARSQGILCQGRGSAANSTACYCLGITSVDPAKMDLLFERFISEERREPPDIDVDFEHERREEVIQYIYTRFGRERAALTATVIHYQPRSALREVGRVMGLSVDTIDRMSKTLLGWGRDGIDETQIAEAGLDPDAERLRLTIELARELIGFPRHLSQHVGGFVITQGPLADLVPIENAAMEDRTIIQWDKDDIDALGILKIDILALGMLTAIRKAFNLIDQHHNQAFTLATVPQDDPAVYDMLSRADSVGVFQVESRAQMTMLPRLRPRTFYDLVIEVAIVRPGPIQGDMVHPYLRRRNGEEQVSYPSKELEQVLGKTLGVPLFQEQAMKIAIVAGGFTPSEADQLRRAMATFRKVGTIGLFQRKLIDGMVANGYAQAFAENCFRQIEGFGEYGFPESHAASFALLVYVSAWLKCHYPAVFAAALLNSQPMGFYAPAQLVRDARDHRVEVRPIDVNHSDWDNTLEPVARTTALRLGFRQIKGAREADMTRLVANRADGYPSLRDTWRRAALTLPVLELLARADAFGSIGLNRRQAHWAIKGLGDKPLPLFEFGDAATIEGSNLPPVETGQEPDVTLPSQTAGEHVVQDYRETSLTLRQHPLALLRPQLKPLGIVQARDLATLPENRPIKLAGLVLVRQRPGTASGVIFATIEDETGVGNIIIWPKVFQHYRRAVLASRLICVTGRVQREGLVIHLIADKLDDYTAMLSDLSDIAVEDDFDSNLAHADEVRKPVREVQVIMPPSRDFR
ncbi:error-prone DNA polymerase [Ferrovibrio sp.]|uniref:error-prone DNA polymerase n=1 Tax=Ferrovibrio sp. TaxID=1917215 RepID=UPI001B6CC0AB|nr:error-prone DNA polymerase [Ferrovibrio sp.]MBP7063436.1 error-prone DNA polymerase [Ferrovibrio sp.]